MPGFVATLILLSGLALASEVAALDITSSGQEVPARQTGVLVADLDRGWPTEELSYGVELGHGPTVLDPRGICTND